MFELNNQLYNKSNVRYLACNILCILISIFTYFFIREEPGVREYVILMIVMSQLLTGARYFVIRTCYREELLVNISGEKSLNINKWSGFISSIYQICIFNFIQLALSYLIVLLLIDSRNEGILLSINFFLSFLVITMIFLFDFVYVNRIKKSSYEEWFIIFVCIMPFVILEFPSNEITLVYMGMLILSIAMNINRIRREFLGRI
ncbi:MAG: hypothetical protein RR840_02705 [Clostridium sp.]